MHFRPLHDRVVVRRPHRAERMRGGTAATDITLTRAADGAPIAAHCTGAPAEPPRRRSRGWPGPRRSELPQLRPPRPAPR